MKLFSGPNLADFAKPAQNEPAAETTTEANGTSAPQRPAATHGATSSDVTTTVGKVRLIQIPRLAAAGRWRVEAMRSLPEPVLLWFTRGQGRITIGGVTRGYGAHNAIFIPAGVMHGFEVGPQVFGTAVFLGRNAGFDLPATPLHLRIREANPQAELNIILDNFQREMNGNLAGRERAAHCYLGLLSVWLERQAALVAEEPKKVTAATRLAARYSAVLEQDFRKGYGVADFAERLGVTPTHLTRVCNQCCGRSASDLLHDRLIFEARQLLAETRMPVAKVAESLGFTSPAYFTRAFQHRTGVTPSSFRKSA